MDGFRLRSRGELAPAICRDHGRLELEQLVEELAVAEVVRCDDFTPGTHRRTRRPMHCCFVWPAETTYQFAGVLLDPQPGCGDIPHPCWNAHTLTFLRNSGIFSLNDRVGSFPTDLNLYIPR